jgi:sterol desaturase/sphingolipid hydroxylase (fatty acid hydroxylase superfamily)
MDNLISSTISLLIDKGYFDPRNLYFQFYQESIGGIFYWEKLLKYFLVSVSLLFIYRYVLKSSKIDVRLLFKLIFPTTAIKYKSFKFDVYFMILHLLKINAIFVKILSVACGLYFLPIFLQSIDFYNNPILGDLNKLILNIDPELRKPVLFFIAFIVYDFFGYLGHFIMHNSKSLWYFHQIHHYPRQITIISTLRAHPVDAIFLSIIPSILMSIILALITPFQISLASSPTLISDTGLLFFIFIFLPGILNFFSHSKLPIGYGKFEYVFLSPNSHLVHHARDISGKNLGATLSIWDHLFGTFYQLKSEEQYLKVINKIGTDDADDNLYKSFIELLITPFIKSFKTLFSITKN